MTKVMALLYVNTIPCTAHLKFHSLGFHSASAQHINLQPSEQVKNYIYDTDNSQFGCILQVWTTTHVCLSHLYGMYSHHLIMFLMATLFLCSTV